jgi:arginyl-tRNA--protein-N-Asp/Glu arginylyltransferase
VNPRWNRGSPPELVVYDAVHPCPYLDGRNARMPMRLPARALTPEEHDQRLAEGDRRHGPFLYRPTCAACKACEAIRLDLSEFQLSRTHRRVLKRGDRELEVELGEPIADDERLALYENHKIGRDLVGASGETLDLKGYEGFLVDRCVSAFELRYRHRGALIGVAITDRGKEALSAVYCCWDPTYSHLSVGTYSILKQLELCRMWGMRYLYLGLYVAGNDAMAYKARYLPHERLIDGRWQRFER